MSDGGGGLSTGATAGIAVGVTLVGVGLIGGLIWFLIKRRRKNKPGAAPELAAANSKKETSHTDNRGSRYSELAVKSPSPTPTPEIRQNRFSGQPSPGFVGPPQYSQHYDGHIVEMVSVHFQSIVSAIDIVYSLTMLTGKVLLRLS